MLFIGGLNRKTKASQRVGKIQHFNTKQRKAKMLMLIFIQNSSAIW